MVGSEKRGGQRDESLKKEASAPKATPFAREKTTCPLEREVASQRDQKAPLSVSLSLVSFCISLASPRDASSQLITLGAGAGPPSPWRAISELEISGRVGRAREYSSTAAGSDVLQMR